MKKRTLLLLLLGLFFIGVGYALYKKYTYYSLKQNFEYNKN